MKKLTVVFIRLTLVICISLFISSCMTTKTSVGDYRESSGREYTYAKSKQIWLFWGLLPVGRTDTATPASGSCEIVTRFNAIDVLISAITGSIVMTETIKVNAKKDK